MRAVVLKGCGRARTSVGVVLLCCLFTGCTTLNEYVHNGFKVGPNYARPPVAVEADWIDSADVRVRKDPDEHRRWWTVFNDPVLNDLVCSASLQNLTVREAAFRVLEARAQLGIALGQLFPQQQVAQGAYSREAVSKKQANRQFTPERFFSNWQFGLAASWELDFWGRFRRAIESSAARLDASIENYDDVMVTLLGDVATAYTQVRIFQRRIELLRKNIALQEETLVIARARFKAGRVDELDVDQAESILAQTKAQIPQLEISLRQAQNQLCVLLGIPPEDLVKKLGPGGIPAASPDVVLGVPADLVRRRPDVRRAEREAAARCAEIGVAEADFYPAISITGQLGYAAKNFSDLFHPQAFFGAVAPSFTWNVLNYGRIANSVLFTEAAFQRSVARYQQTVLLAFQDVENGVVGFLKSQEAARELAVSVRAAEKSVVVVVARYKGGLENFNRVAVIEQNLVQQQDLLAQAQGSIALGLIQTYRALGGGWQIRLDGCTPGAACITASAPAPATPENLPAPKPDRLPAPRKDSSNGR